jgi:methyl-accepting chemotaxis protein
MPDENQQINKIQAINEQLARILRGEKGENVEALDDLDPVLKELGETVNRLVSAYNEMREFILSLAQGNLEVPPPLHNLLASPFKQLQASLLHLTWQTRQIAAGDYSQRVYFMGDFSTAFNSMVEALEEKRQTEALLREAQAKVKHLEGIIPICMYCKKIRDDMESWQQMEQYITEHSEALFSHGICPECYGKVRSDLGDKKAKVEATKKKP